MKTPRDARALTGLLFAITVLCALPVLLSAVAPTWWTTEKVYRFENGSVADALDYSAANQGQLKKMAIGAYEHMTKAIPPSYCKIWTFPNGSTSTNGEALRDLVRQWVEIDYNPSDGSGTGKVKRHIVGDPNASPSITGTGPIAIAPDATDDTDYAAVTQGQLKAVAKVFYKRLEEVYRSRDQSIQYPFPTPWRGGVPWTDDDSSATTADTEDDENRALVNIGQLKAAFKFDLHSDIDQDGKSDIDEIIDPVPPGGVPNNPYNPDSDGDGLLDGEEPGSNAHFSDSDGDGFVDGEDHWPNDGRRGDFIPPKFYALTDLSSYVPPEFSGAKNAQGIAINDEGQVAFYGLADGEAHVVVWKDGQIDTQKSFDVDLGKSQLFAQVTHPDGSQSGVLASDGVSIAGIAPDGTLAISYGTNWDAYATVYPDGSISPGDEVGTGKAMVLSAPGTLPPLVEEYDYEELLKTSYSIAMSQDGTPLNGKDETIESPNARSTNIGLAREDGFIEALKWTRTEAWDPYTVTYSNVNYALVGIPHYPQSFSRLSTSSDIWMSLVKPMNPRGDVYVEKHTYYEDNGVGFENPRVGYYICKKGEAGGTSDLIEAPAGILAFNDQLQAIGCDPLPSGDPGPAFFAEYNPATEQWFKTDLTNLLRWLNKPSGTKDDYDRYFARSGSGAEAQIKDIIPKLLTNADPATSGVTISEGGQSHTFTNGLPRTIIAECNILAAGDANGSNSDGYANYTTVWTCERGGTSSDTRYQIRTLLLEPGISLEISAINASGALAGTFTTADNPGIDKPALADGIEFNVNTATEEGRLDVDLGFDPPHEADLGQDGEVDTEDEPLTLKDDDLRNWRWNTSVWAKRMEGTTPLHDEKAWHNTRIVVDFPDQAVRARYRILLHGSAQDINWIDQFDTEELGAGGDPKRYRVRLKVRTLPTSDPAKLNPEGDPPFVSIIVVPTHPSISGIVNRIITQDFKGWMASTPILRVWIMPAPKVPIPAKLSFVYHKSPQEIPYPEKFDRAKIRLELDTRFFAAGLNFRFVPETGPFPEATVSYDSNGNGLLDTPEWNTIETNPQTINPDASGNKSVPIYVVKGLLNAKGGGIPIRGIAINATSWEDPKWDNMVIPERRSSTRERTIAHEMGHYLFLSTRSSEGENGSLHDPACSVRPFRIPSTVTWPPPDPFKTSQLMKAKGGGCGTWFRWEDWLKGNKTARERFRGNFDP